MHRSNFKRGDVDASKARRHAQVRSNVTVHAGAAAARHGVAFGCCTSFSARGNAKELPTTQLASAATCIRCPSTHRVAVLSPSFWPTPLALAVDEFGGAHSAPRPSTRALALQSDATRQRQRVERLAHQRLARIQADDAASADVAAADAPALSAAIDAALAGTGAAAVDALETIRLTLVAGVAAGLPRRCTLCRIRMLLLLYLCSETRCP